MNRTVFLSGETLSSFLFLIIISVIVFGFPLFIICVTLFEDALKRRKPKNRKVKENEIASSQSVSVAAKPAITRYGNQISN